MDWVFCIGGIAVLELGAYGEIKEMWSRSAEAAVQCTQIKPTIWSEPFDRALREADDHDDDGDDDDNDDDYDHDDHDDDGDGDFDDDHTCESAIGVRRGEEELI